MVIFTLLDASSQIHVRVCTTHGHISHIYIFFQSFRLFVMRANETLNMLKPKINRIEKKAERKQSERWDETKQKIAMLKKSHVGIPNTHSVSQNSVDRRGERHPSDVYM